MAWIPNLLVLFLYFYENSNIFLSKNSGVIGVYDRSMSDAAQMENDFNRFKKVEKNENFDIF